VTAVRAGMAVAHARLRGGRPAVVGLALLVVTVWAAVHLHRSAPLDAADVALGSLLGWCVPLIAYAAVSRACLRGRLDLAVSQLARHGVSRRGAAVGLLCAVMVPVASLSAGLSGTAALLAHGALTSFTLADAVTSAWIGALAGAAYVAWFGVGSLWGKKGGGRSLALLVDAVLGSTASLVALPWPRAHVRALLGGELAHGLPEWKSTCALYVLTGAYLVFCAVRSPR
jgi:hypothetical protein